MNLSILAILISKSVIPIL